MPNQENIDRPITLVGSGRSGTTLLTNLFRAHPHCESLGETGDLVFTTYHNVRSTLPICGPFFSPENAGTHARGAVHTLLRSLASSDRPHWFHKPIQIPKARCFFDNDDTFLRWWWSAHETLFPDACTFTVLREPRDLIVSSMRRWSFSKDQAVSNLELIYRWLLHEESRCGFALRFDELVESPEATVRALLARVGLPYDPVCLQVFDQCHSPNEGSDGLDTLEAMTERGHRHPESSDLDIGRNLPELYNQLVERYCTPPG